MESQSCAYPGKFSTVWLEPLSRRDFEKRGEFRNKPCEISSRRDWGYYKRKGDRKPEEEKKFLGRILNALALG